MREAHPTGYTLTPAVVRAGRPLTLTLYWAAQTVANRDWAAFVHLLDAAGRV